MLECSGGCHPSEDKLQRNNCHIYVTSIMIVAFLMFFFSQRTLSAVIIQLVPLVAFLCILYSHVVQECFCVSNNVASDECYVLDKVALGIQQTCDASALCVQQINVAKEIKHSEEFRSRYAIFLHCNPSIENCECHVRKRFDREPNKIPVQKEKTHYSLYILPIGCIGVSIYHADNESFKIFDSHARDNMVEAISWVQVYYKKYHSFRV